MCGIAGFNWKNRELVKGMIVKMKFRGPDSDGIFIDSNVSLGHRRLSIIDLSEAGNQPMQDSTGEILIVYNGEIYNFISIRNELCDLGYNFETETDTEVIISAYKEWGVKCLRKFIGMFSFCIYDKNRNIFFLARDHIGIKPLYYFQSENKFNFSHSSLNN